MDGEARRLMGEDQYTGEPVVDISPLTEAMKNISREYISLERRNECIHHRFE